MIVAYSSIVLDYIGRLRMEKPNPKGEKGSTIAEAVGELRKDLCKKMRLKKKDTRSQTNDLESKSTTFIAD